MPGRLRQVGGERLADLGGARVRGRDRQRAGGGGLRGDHPERLREGAREDERVRRGDGRRRPRRARGARRTRRCRRRRARRPRSPSGRRSRNAESIRSRSSSPSSSPRPCSASSRSGPRSPAARPSETLCSTGASAPKPTISSRASGWPACTSGQAASSRSTPLETISLPTKITRGPLALGEPVDRVRRGHGVAVPARRRWSASSSSRRRGRERLERERALRRRDRREQVRVDTRRAEADLRVGHRVVDRLAQAGGDVAGADQDPRGAVAGLLRVRAAALEVGDHGVGEVGAVDRKRVVEPGAAEDHRPHDQVVGERRVDAAERLDQLADRRDVRLEVAVELGVGELGERLDLEALVGVVDEDRQQAADVGGVDRDRARTPPAPSSGGSRSWQRTWTS